MPAQSWRRDDQWRTVRTRALVTASPRGVAEAGILTTRDGAAGADRGVAATMEDGLERGRRILNIIVAAVGLVACIPVMALVALVIKLTSRGPVLFVQTRVGLDRRNGRDELGGNSRRKQNLGGKPFQMYKFRTMKVNGSEPQAQTWASPDDCRVTAVGRLLRKYRLDELPQLVNVLSGDMNVVGPRPEQPEIFCTLRGQIPGYHGRQLVRPGITGWAQINQQYDRTLEDVEKKLRLDLEYIRRRSMQRDLLIMVRTIPVMLLRRGSW